MEWKIGQEFVRQLHRLTILTAALCVCTTVAPALELWDDVDPGLPKGVRRATIVRTVTYARGEALPSTAVRHRDIERRSEDHISQRVYDDAGIHLWTTHLLYERHMLKEVRAESERGVRWTVTFSYNTRGRLMRESLAAPDSSELRTVTYEYGSESLEVISYRSDGSVAWRRIEQIQNNGGERRTRYYYADGTRVKTVIADLDEDGRTTHERHLDELGTVYRTVEREYAGNQVLRETVRDQADTTLRHTKWAYGAEGRLTDVTVTLPADGIVEHTKIIYDLDQVGNWIAMEKTMRVQRDDEPVRIIDRERLERRLTYE